MNTEKKSKLTQKNKLFCERFLLSNNQTLAYMEVYEEAKENTARVNASKLLKRKDVQEYLNAIRKEVYLRNIDEVEKILADLKNIYTGKASAKKYFKSKGELVEVDVQATISERLKAMQMYIAILGYNNVFGNDYYYINGETMDTGENKTDCF